METNIRKDWQRTDINIGVAPTSIDEIMEGKRKTALQNLAQRYRWFSNVALVILVANGLNIFNLMRLSDNETAVIVLGIIMSVYFIICSVMDRWLYAGICSIDILMMPVMEVVRKAGYYRKRHLQFIFILMPLALGMVGALLFLFENIYFRLGILLGFLLGVALGIRQLFNFLADYRDLIRENQDIKKNQDIKM